MATYSDNEIRVRLGSITPAAYQKRVSFNLSLTHVGHHHPYNLALCGSLMRVHGLRVHVESDPAVGVPQELLYRLHISPFAFSNVPKEWRKVCQPMFLVMPA
jgi:hypothetical protein